MPSSSDSSRSPSPKHHNSKKESSPIPNPAPNHQQPEHSDGHPPPPTDAPPMGYHPQMSSQPGQYQLNYYHNGYNQYAYAQPPPASYYYQQNNTNDRRATEFIRGFLFVIFF
ncbi:hypothetical protein SLA2020_409030 [Shorea laevis]